MLYEQEHGLKRGRQRIRQLIEEGKRYEQDHGLKDDGGKARVPRRSRVSREQVLRNLLQSLSRMAKPSFRPHLARMLQALEAVTD